MEKCEFCLQILLIVYATALIGQMLCKMSSLQKAVTAVK